MTYLSNTKFEYRKPTVEGPKSMAIKTSLKPSMDWHLIIANGDIM